MSETPELTVLALTAIQRETFVVLWLFKMCTKVCFFPLSGSRSYQEVFNELSVKKNMLAQLQTRELNFNFACYLSFKKVFYHYFEIIIGVYLLGCLWDAKSIWKIRIALMDPCFSLAKHCLWSNERQLVRLEIGTKTESFYYMAILQSSIRPEREMNSFEFEFGCDLSVGKTSTLIFLSFQSNCFPKNFWLLQWNICLQGKHSFLLLWSWKKETTHILSYSKFISRAWQT